MLGETTAFFSDPRALLSLLAVLLSVAAYLSTLRNQREQNRRWDLLNNASITVADVRVKSWQTLPREKAMATKWGYQALVVGFGDSNDCKVLSRLCAYERDGKDAPFVEGLNAVVTIDELRKDLKRIGRDITKVVVGKHHRIEFELENTGKIEAADCDAAVFAIAADHSEERVFGPSPKIRIPPGKKARVPVDLYWRGDTQLPRHIPFRVRIDFPDAHGFPRFSETILTWDTLANEWAHGEVKTVS